MHSMAAPDYANAWAADDLIAYAAERTGKSIKYIILTTGMVRLIKGYQPPPKILTLPKDTGR